MLRLQCPPLHLIAIKDTFWGWTSRNDTCHYNSGDPDNCYKITTASRNCNGRTICSMYVSNPFLENCQAFATYMQANYSCIPGTFLWFILSLIQVSSRSTLQCTVCYSRFLECTELIRHAYIWKQVSILSRIDNYLYY